jgi:hypothetical protein
MPREKANFRDELEQLSQFFGDGQGNCKRVLFVSDVARYIGRDPRWCKRAYNIDPQQGISVVALAKKLADTEVRP